MATVGLACRALSALLGTGSPDLCFFPKKPKLHYNPLQNQPPPGTKHGDCRVCGASYRVTLPVSAHMCVCMCVSFCLMSPSWQCSSVTRSSFPEPWSVISFLGVLRVSLLNANSGLTQAGWHERVLCAPLGPHGAGRGIREAPSRSSCHWPPTCASLCLSGQARGS